MNRIKRALVESYVGAIALGYLLAEVILHFVNIFSSPVAGWVAQNEYSRMIPGIELPSHSPLRYAIPQLVAFIVLSAVWYALLRWLYLEPSRENPYPALSSPQEG